MLNNNPLNNNPLNNIQNQPQETQSQETQSQETQPTQIVEEPPKRNAFNEKYTNSNKRSIFDRKHGASMKSVNDIIVEDNQDESTQESSQQHTQESSQQHTQESSQQHTQENQLPKTNTFRERIIMIFIGMFFIWFLFTNISGVLDRIFGK